MADRSDHEERPRRIVIVEDRVAYLRTIMHKAPSHDTTGTPVQLQTLDHQDAARRQPEAWVGIDLVLLDAYDLAAQQVDPSASRFAALAVIDALETIPTPPRVVAYSTTMRRPEVNIPLRRTRNCQRVLRRGRSTRTSRSDRQARLHDRPDATTRARRLPTSRSRAQCETEPRPPTHATTTRRLGPDLENATRRRREDPRMDQRQHPPATRPTSRQPPLQRRHHSHPNNRRPTDQRAPPVVG